MAKFHRFADPSYFLFPGESFPAAPGGTGTIGVHTYDRVNVENAGAGAGGSANADVQVAAGVNQFTYFVAFGQFGTSLNTNRGFRAAFESMDVLDDVVRTSLPKRAAQSAASPAASNVVVTGEVFVSENPATPASELFYLVETATGRPIYNGATPVTVIGVDTGVPGTIIGTTWATNPRVLFSGVVSVPYTLYYGTRTSVGRLSETEPSAWWTQYVASLRLAGYGEAQGLHGFDERYRRSTTLTDGNAQANTPGDGAVFTRDGQALTALVPNSLDYTTNRQEDPYGASFLTRQVVDNVFAKNNSGGGIGYLGLAGYSNEADAGERYSGNGVSALTAQYIPRDIQAATLHGNTTRTYVPKGAGATLNPGGAGGDLVEIDAPYYFRVSSETAIRTGRCDALLVTYGDGTTQLYRIVSLTADNQVSVVTQAGAAPAFAADEVVTIQWLSMHTSLGELEPGPHSGFSAGFRLLQPERTASDTGESVMPSGVELVGAARNAAFVGFSAMLSIGHSLLGDGGFSPKLRMFSNGTISGKVSGGANNTGYLQHVLCHRDNSINTAVDAAISVDPVNNLGGHGGSPPGAGFSLLRVRTTGALAAPVELTIDRVATYVGGMVVEVWVENTGGMDVTMVWDAAFRFSDPADAQLGAANGIVGRVVRWRATYMFDEFFMERLDY